MHTHEHEHAGDRKLIGAVAVNLLLTIVQVVGGVAAGSLSLVADALHNLSDAASLGIALVARRIARKPADKLRTFGYRRAEIIGALINLTSLILVGVYLIYEAITRALNPNPVDGWIVIWIAGVALAVDLATAALTFKLSRGNLNIRAAFIHNVSDAMASVAVIVAGTLILLYEWYWTDLAATVLISGYVIYQGVTVMRASVSILMEGVPHDVQLNDVAEALAELPDVHGVHHLHVWQLDEYHRALEAHFVVHGEFRENERLKRSARELLMQRFKIGHSTFELEVVGEECGGHSFFEGCLKDPG